MASHGKALTWDGLDTFKQELHAMPETFVENSRAYAINVAFEMADALRAAYPFVTGALRGGVVVRRAGQGAKVLSTARHAMPFEFGRQTGNHGTTPPRPTFFPLRERYQRKLVDQIVWLVESYGFKTHGAP